MFEAGGDKVNLLFCMIQPIFSLQGNECDPESDCKYRTDVIFCSARIAEAAAPLLARAAANLSLFRCMLIFAFCTSMIAVSRLLITT